jgi:hypothetical protein
MDLVRYDGKWIKIVPKSYEPERQTHEIAWSMVLNPTVNSACAYRNWYLKERENAKVLYPSFRKDGA